MSSVPSVLNGRELRGAAGGCDGKRGRLGWYPEGGR